MNQGYGNDRDSTTINMAVTMDVTINFLLVGIFDSHEIVKGTQRVSIVCPQFGHVSASPSNSNLQWVHCLSSI